MSGYQSGAIVLQPNQTKAVRDTDPEINYVPLAAATPEAHAGSGHVHYEEEDDRVLDHVRLTHRPAAAAPNRPQFEYFTVSASLCPGAAARTGQYVPFGVYQPRHSGPSTRSTNGRYAVVARSRDKGVIWVSGPAGVWQRSSDGALADRLPNSAGQVQRPPVLYTVPHESLAEARRFDGPFDPYGRYETSRFRTQSSRRIGSYAVAAVDHRGTWVLNNAGWELLPLGDHRLARLGEQLQRHQDLVGRVDRISPGNVSKTVRDDMLRETLERLRDHARTANGPTLRFLFHDGNPQIHAKQLAGDLARHHYAVARVSCQGQDKIDPIKAAILQLFLRTEKATVDSWQEQHPRSYFTVVEKLNYRLVDCAAAFLKWAGSARVTDGHALGDHVFASTLRLKSTVTKVKVQIVPSFIQVEGERAARPIAPTEIQDWARALRAALVTVNRRDIVPVILIEGTLTDEQMALLSELTREATHNRMGPRLRLQVVLVDGASTRQLAGHHSRIRTVEFAHLNLEQVRADVQACADLHQIELRDGALEALADCVSQVATTRDNVTITAERIETEPIYLWRGELFTLEELEGRLPLGGPVSVRTTIHPSRANYVVVNAGWGRGLAEQIHPLQVQDGNVTLNGQVVAGFSFDADGVLTEFGNLGAERMLSWLGDMNDRTLSPSDVAVEWPQYVASYGSPPRKPQAWVRPTVGLTAPVAAESAARGSTQVVVKPVTLGRTLPRGLTTRFGNDMVLPPYSGQSPERCVVA